MSAISFKPRKITESLRSDLPDRAHDVITSRYGLGESQDTQTLESIGERYGITRERVRQIESDSLREMRESNAFKENQDNFSELHDLFHKLGVILQEQSFLDHVSEDRRTQNHTLLILDLGDSFQRERSNDSFHHRWHVDERVASAVHKALDRLHDRLDRDELISEKEVLKRFLDHIDGLPSEKTHYLEDEDVLSRWIEISKKVGQNPLGEWGHMDSSNVDVKGVRDYAYLVIRRHGSPMHFREVTERIGELFEKKAHEATTHNELIKDDRFVLVGRGLYALKEWGYMTGVVREVIEKILERDGPMTRDELVDKVLKERYVKPNTVVVNLQSEDQFQKNSVGKYELNRRG